VGAIVNAALAIKAAAPDTYPPAQIEAPMTGRRHLFLVEGLDAIDALLRVLGPFAVQSGRLAEVSFSVADGRIAVRLEVEGLSQDRAEHLHRRLGQLPLVTSVSLGWRGGGG
jgi:hypothetical protein